MGEDRRMSVNGMWRAWAGFLFLAGCTAQGPNETQAPLEASAAAQAFGVAAYRVMGGEVELLDEHGGVRATLSVTRRGEQRDITVVDPSTAATYLNEITRPIDGHFVAPVETSTLEGTVQ